ncbi:hypothetical protein AB0I54_15150 [Streptomyces sp. NPDC050625]|uniref:hypothetical protein n=1 Tax=Streptomyces sp. NPDC050625 TaxID=3154629 RepID=UPI003448BC54
MRKTTDTYQTVLPEMHAATASASLDLITAYRKAEQKAGKTATKKGKKGKQKARIDKASGSAME